MSKFKIGRPKLTDPLISKDERKAHKKELHKEWEKRNADKLRKYHREYQSIRKDKQKLKYQRYMDRHPGRKRELHKLWYSKNKDKVKMRNGYYYERRKAALIDVPIGEKIKITKWIQSWRCLLFVKCHWCNRELRPSAVHIDHVLPITLGGKHRLNNLVVSCPRCNLSKHNKHPKQFLMELSQSSSDKNQTQFFS